MSEHTKVPWRATEPFNGGDADIVDDKGFEVCEVPSTCILLDPSWASKGYRHWSDAPGKSYVERSEDETIANARFIVLACNHHEELVKAVKESLSILDEILEYTDGDDGEMVENPFLVKLRALLARIEGEK